MSIVFRNTIWQVSEKILRMGGGLLMTVLVAKQLGPEGFGLLNYAFAFSTFFQVLTGLGYEATLVKLVLERLDVARKIMGMAILMRFTASVLMLGGALGLIWVTEPDRPVLWQMIALLGLAFIVQAGETIDFQFQAVQQMHKTSLIRLGGFLASVLFRLWLIFAGKDIVWFAASLLVESVFDAVFFLIFSRKDSVGFPVFNQFYPDIGKKLLKVGIPMVFSSMVWILYSRLDQIMVARYLGDAQSGFFSVSTRIVEVFIFIPTALASSMLPGLISSLKEGHSFFRSKMQRLMDMVLLLGLLVCAFLVLFAPLVVRYSFGDRYLPAADALTIQGFVCIFSFLGSAAQPFFIARNITGLLFFRNLAGALLNVLLNLFWIPAYGIAGACYATLVSTFLVNVGYNVSSEKSRELLAIQGKSVLHLLNGKSWLFLFDFLRNFRKGL